MPQVESLTPSMLPELLRFWNASFDLDPMNESLLAERVFGPPDARPENLLCFREAGGEITAISLLAPPSPPGAAKQTPARGPIGGIRWFGVHPDWRKQGLGKQLLEESCARLKAAGAASVDLAATPPFYIRPGVDLRQTDTIVWFLRRGFSHVGTNLDMTADLSQAALPPAEEVFAPLPGGYRIRRATAADREPFARYCLSEWTENWKNEAGQGLDHDPVSLFLAVKLGSSEGAETGAEPAPGEEEIVGFASYETNQCLGSFGPTGVTPSHRGHRLGRLLLFATLIDLKALGRPVAEIGWIGPIEFYRRAAGARIGPIYSALRRALE